MKPKSKVPITTGELRGYINKAVDLLEARNALNEIPDARLLVSRIHLTIASPEDIEEIGYANAENSNSVALSTDYSFKKHHVAIECFTPYYTNEEDPKMESAVWIATFAHELAHILLKIEDETEAHLLQYEALTQMGFKYEMTPEEWIKENKEYYEDRKLAWRSTLPPYLKILRGQMTKREVTAWFARQHELEKRDRLGRLIEEGRREDE